MEKQTRDEMLNGIILPALIGSEKQIAWAEQIRDESIDEMVAAQHQIVECLSEDTTVERAEHVMRCFAARIAQLLGRDSVRFWIDEARMVNYEQSLTHNLGWIK